PGHALVELFGTGAVEQLGDGEDLERRGEAEPLVGPMADRGAVRRIDGTHADPGLELVFEGLDVRGELGVLGAVLDLLRVLRGLRGAAGSRRLLGGGTAGEGECGERRSSEGSGEGPQ